MSASTIGTINLAVSCGLLVLIWVVQLVHYPFFRFLDPGQFPAAMAYHQRQISLIVLPLMVTELAIALGLTYLAPTLINGAALCLVLGVWLSTFCLQVPLHSQLLETRNPAVIERLIRSNWLRTALWSFKVLLLSLPTAKVFVH
jgi:hypothetical protein